MDKPFKTFDEQVNILKSRKILCETDTKYKLMENNYYSTINFYKKPFCTDSDTYCSGTHINEIFSLMEFDKNIREVFFSALTQAEKTLKTLIAYHFSKNCPNDKSNLIESYFLTHNYLLNDIKNLSTYLKVMKSIYRIIKKNNNIINHYSKKDNTPLWVCIHFLTFGEVSLLFSILPQKVKIEIADSIGELYNYHYDEVSNKKFPYQFIESFLLIGNLYRNVCAHNERLYDFTSKEKLSTQHMGNYINTGSTDQGLYTVYESLKIFLSKEKYQSLTDRIDENLNKLENNLNVIKIDKILTEMRFPIIDWKKI